MSNLTTERKKQFVRLYSLIVTGLSIMALPVGLSCADTHQQNAPVGEAAGATVARARTLGVDDRKCDRGNFTPEVIRIGIDAMDSKTDVEGRKISNWQPIGDYLTRETGRIVEVVPIEDYAQLTDGLVSGTLHGALMPPMEFIHARTVIPCLEASATSVYGTSTSYSTSIIVKRGSSFLTVANLKGHRIAFVSRNSASGFLYAVKFLADQGLRFNKDYEPVFAGTHLEVIRLVQQGMVDAGATFGQAIGKASENAHDVSGISILAVTGQIPVEPLVLLPTLDSTLSRRIVNAFLDLNTNSEEGRRALAGQNLFTGWVTTDNSFYDSIEELSEQVDSLVGTPPAGTQTPVEVKQ